MRQLNTTHSQFSQQLSALLDRSEIINSDVIQCVCNIIQQIQTKGDAALLQLTEQLDHWKPKNTHELTVDKKSIERAWNTLDKKTKSALKEAHKRIETFHSIQSGYSEFEYTDADGTHLAQKILPIERVGLYVPGGQAAYPSSVLMNAIPAQIAGVKELCITTPTPNATINNSVLAAAHLCQINTIYRVGGAQAIAALCFGTSSIPQVDKIVGPGNQYVAVAKKQLFGLVGIDMIAGPSEILIVADENSNPDWLAMDLFSQAEHDQNAQAILISTSPKLLERVNASIEKQLPKMPRQSIIEAALKQKGALILSQTDEETIHLINKIAPEHLELAVKTPDKFLPHIQHAGAVFIGEYTCESMGDYCAGSNHVLPTSGSARFASGLSVYDFQKRISTVTCTRSSAKKLGKIASTLARDESLFAHAASAEYRTKS